MALPNNLKSELRQILRNFGAANGLAAVPGGAGKALEAWVFMRLANEAHRTGQWRVTLCRGDGSPLPLGATFTFATWQAGIQPASLSAPCFVRLERIGQPRKRLELHGGLQWRGRSDATHEIDVSAIPAIIAEALRSRGGGLPRGLPVVAVECKDKPGAGTPDEMRQTLARIFDLALVTSPGPPIARCRTFEDVSNVTWGRRSPTYRSFFAKGTFAVARVGGFMPGAERLGRHYHVQRVGLVYSTSAQALAGLEASFRTTLAGLDGF